MFTKSRNPLLTFLLGYNVWVTSKIQVNFRYGRYWWFCLINFCNFHTIHVFEVWESIAYISTELPCLGDLENPVRLPVQGVLGGTGECVLQIFEISRLLMFLGSRNPLLIFQQSYHVWVTSKIQVDSRFNTYSEVLVIVSCRVLKFLHYLCCILLTFLLSYHVRGTSKIQVTFRFKRF